MAVRLCVCIFFVSLAVVVCRSIACCVIGPLSLSLSLCLPFPNPPPLVSLCFPFHAGLPAKSLCWGASCMCMCVCMCVCASVRCARYVSVCSLVPQMAALFLARFDFESCVQNVDAHHYASRAHPSIQCHKRGCAVEPSASASHQTLCLAVRDYIYMCVCA